MHFIIKGDKLNRFIYPEADISWKEKEKIRHEIDTLYNKYDGLPLIAHRSIGFDGNYYIYYVENLGYDELNIFMRVEDLDEEDG